MSSEVSSTASRAQVGQIRCAVLNCRKRTYLIRTKTFGMGLLFDLYLCRRHAEEHDRHLHEKFVDHFGVDFVDPERN